MWEQVETPPKRVVFYWPFLYNQIIISVQIVEGTEMSVHLEISKKVQEKLNIVETYRKLDEKRELYITEALEKEKSGGDFNVDKINQVTEEINQFAAIHHLPVRKFVTKQMIKEYLYQS
jgi:hypothetical protein